MSERYYRSRLVIPALWVQYEPHLKKLMRLTYFRPAWRLQWRYPRQLRNFRR